MNITDFLLTIAVASSFSANSSSSSSGNSDNDKGDIQMNNDECFIVDKTDMEENLNYMISDRDFSKINENAINELRVNYSLNQDTYIKYRRKRIEACIYAVCLALLIIALAVEWFCISDNSVKAIATISLTVISIVFRVLMVVSDKRISQFFEEEDENGNFNGNCLYGLTSEQMDHIFKYRYKTFDELLTFESYSSLAYESGYVKNTHIKADKIISIELSGKKTSQTRLAYYLAYDLAYDEITFYFLSDKKDIQKETFPLHASIRENEQPMRLYYSSAIREFWFEVPIRFVHKGEISKININLSSLKCYN